MSDDIPTLFVGGLPIIAINRVEFAQMMVRDWHRVRDAKDPPAPKVSFSANGELLSLNASDVTLSKALKQADTIDADGQSLVIFTKLRPGPALPERISTTDFFHDAAKVAEENGIRFYFLGATDEVVRNTVSTVQDQYPNLKIVGWHNGYFSSDKEEKIFAAIRETKPDIVWVGMGSPRQQLFCIRARDQLKGVTWIKSCGGLFDFLSGKNRRAPLWMQDMGLEWLFRMALEPRRLFARYAVTNVHAIYLMLFRRT